MARAANKVIDAEFKEKLVLYDGSGVHINLRDSNFENLKSLYLDSNTVVNY